MPIYDRLFNVSITCVVITLATTACSRSDTEATAAESQEQDRAVSATESEAKGPEVEDSASLADPDEFIVVRSPEELVREVESVPGSSLYPGRTRLMDDTEYTWLVAMPLVGVEAIKRALPSLSERDVNRIDDWLFNAFEHPMIFEVSGTEVVDAHDLPFKTTIGSSGVFSVRPGDRVRITGTAGSILSISKVE